MTTKERVTGNNRGGGVGRSFQAWSATVYPTSRVVGLGTGCLRALRREMVCVLNRIDDELKRREPR